MKRSREILMVTGFYVLNSLVWSIVGGLVGYRYCKMQMDINELKRQKSMDEIPTYVNGEKHSAPVRASRFDLHAPSMQQAIGIVVVVLAIITVGFSVNSSQRLNAVSSCLAGYVDSYNRVLKDRDEVSSQSRSALRDFIIADNALWAGFLENASKPGQQQTQAQRDASIATLTRFFGQAKTVIAALEASSQAKQRFPIPDNNCPDAPKK